jgi:TRAP-type C4-dicarboxylate transport system permease small subunit
MKLAAKLIPQGVKERSQPAVVRFQTRVRDFEWTWTKAVVIAFVLWFLAIGLIGFLPSWWLYFADQKLGWNPCPCPDTLAWIKYELRDVIAIILFSIPFGAFIIVPYHLQKLRRRLRSESESRPTGGYR